MAHGVQITAVSAIILGAYHRYLFFGELTKGN